MPKFTRDLDLFYLFDTCIMLHISERYDNNSLLFTYFTYGCIEVRIISTCFYEL